MPGQLGNAVKEARSRAAIAVADQMKQAYLARQEGNEQPVLFEEESDGYFTGYCPNYVKVYATGVNLHNEICPVRLGKPFRDGVFGEIL